MNELLCCAGFEDTDVPPKLFVLMGNFQSDTDADASSGFAAVRENFNALAALLRTFRLFRVRLSFWAACCMWFDVEVEASCCRPAHVCCAFQLLQCVVVG